MINVLQKLNDVSPFLWELVTDGHRYTILCEGVGVHDAKTGIELTDMSEKKCVLAENTVSENEED